MPVATPFFHVAGHVVDAQFVGAIGLYGLGLCPVLGEVAYVAFLVAPAELVASALVASSCGKLPLCLGGKAEGIAR